MKKIFQSDTAMSTRTWQPKKIVVDASCLISRKSGVGYYTANSVAALMKFLPDTEFHIFLGYNWSRTIPEKDPLTAQLTSTARQMPFIPWLWCAIRAHRFRSYLKSTRADLIFASNYIPSAPCESVVPVVYDLSHVRMPHALPPDRLRRLRKLDALLKSVEAVVTISEFSKNEIAELQGVPREKIFVATPGVAPTFHPVPMRQRLPALHRLGLEDRRYFLAMGNLEPRKNLSSLIEAYKKLPQSIKNRFVLAIGGSTGWGNSGVPSDPTDELQRSGQLRLLGYVPAADLAALYSGAAAFCFPSHYEGFGMPVIEAMACAAPVLASNAAAIPEAAGDAGLLLDPCDIQAWVAGLQGIVDDEAWADHLRNAGPSQAAGFSWDNCARSIIEAFQHATATVTT